MNYSQQYYAVDPPRAGQAVSSVRSWGLCLMLIMSHNLLAQKTEYFTVNKRNINVSEFNRDVEALLKYVEIPGASLAIIENDSVVFFNAYGYKRSDDDKKVNKKTVFEACSLSKTFLAYVAYQLVDEGKLDLDKPMYQYLESERLQHDPRYKLITPRMILSHSSGIENWQGRNNPDTLEIITHPGEKYIYSGEGYEYLAKVVELILDQPYEKYVRQRVIRPLRLKRSFTSFSLMGKHPANYAVGHWGLGGIAGKWRNPKPVPAAGNNVTAEDYAKLMVAIFDKKHLSASVIKAILQPQVPVAIENPDVFYGPGFEIVYSEGDTIISHGGSNGGFKAQAFYSVVHRRGFVIMTNSDRGMLIPSQLCEMSVGLKIAPYYRHWIYKQYPSKAIDLIKIFKQQGAGGMFAEVDRLKKTNQLEVNTLNELGDFFSTADKNISKKLLMENISLFPTSPTAYSILGMINQDLDEYELAYDNFMKAKALNFTLWEIDKDIQACRDKLGYKP